MLYIHSMKFAAQSFTDSAGLPQWAKNNFRAAKIVEVCKSETNSR